MDLVQLDQIAVEPENLLEQKQNVIHHRLPKQTQVSLINQLNTAVQNATIMQQTFNDKNMFNKHIFNNLQGFKVYEYSKIWKFDQAKLRQLSVLPILRMILFQEIKQLITIQFQVDIFSQQLIKMPSKKPVFEFIEQFFRMKSLFEMYDALVKQMTPQVKSEETSSILKYKFYFPILRFIRKIIQIEFGYMVDRQAIKILILNPYEDLFLTSIENIVEYQSQQIKIGVKGYVDQAREALEMQPQQFVNKKKEEMIENMKFCLVSFAKKRKLIKKQKHFFSILKSEDEPMDLNKIATTAFNHQTKLIESLDPNQTKYFSMIEGQNDLDSFVKLSSSVSGI